METSFNDLYPPYDDERIGQWVEKTDADLSIEAYENFMLPDEITFQEFYEAYNKLHLAKYGTKLVI